MLATAISDMHGQHEDVLVPESDVLFICGDIVPLRMQIDVPRSFNWFEKRFIKWCQSLPVKQIYLVGGNHDFFLQERDKTVNEYLQGTKITYLNNTSAEYVDND